MLWLYTMSPPNLTTLMSSLNPLALALQRVHPIQSNGSHESSSYSGAQASLHITPCVVARHGHLQAARPTRVPGSPLTTSAMLGSSPLRVPGMAPLVGVRPSKSSWLYCSSTMHSTRCAKHANHSGCTAVVTVLYCIMPYRAVPFTITTVMC